MIQQVNITNNRNQFLTYPQCIIIIFIFYSIAILSNYLIFVVWNLIKWLWPQTNLLKRYSHKQEKCWAVVTGATDGIGLGFCEELLFLGFNLCLVSRNQQKINQVIQKLQAQKTQQLKDCKIIGIQFDFTQMQNKQAYQKLLNQLNKLDIGILVNNVGVSFIKSHQKASYKQVLNVLNVNCMGMACLNNSLIPKLKQRKAKSAIINLSSLSGYNAMPYISLYSSTKSFNTFISEGLSIEYPNIDILSVEPMLVESAGSKATKKLNVPTSRQCAKDSLRELKFKSHKTLGYIMHRVTGMAALTFLPKSVLRKFGKKQMENLIKTYGYDKRQ